MSNCDDRIEISTDWYEETLSYTSDNKDGGSESGEITDDTCSNVEMPPSHEPVDTQEHEVSTANSNITMHSYQIKDTVCNVSNAKEREDPLYKRRFAMMKRQHKNTERLFNIRYMMPFIVTTHFIIRKNEITFTRVGICNRLSAAEFRGYSYKVPKNKQSIGNHTFIESENVKKNLYDYCMERQIPATIINMLKSDLHENKIYERNGYEINPIKIVSFIRDKCSEPDIVQQPLLITWQNFQNLQFLHNHIKWDRRIAQCSLCGRFCNTQNFHRNNTTSNSSAYFQRNINGGVHIICNSKLHNVSVDGLINPVWINIIISKDYSNNQYQLQFNYENKITVFSIPLPYDPRLENTSRNLPNIEEIHSLIGCKEPHETAKTVSGMMTHVKCIFYKYYDKMCQEIENMRYR